MTAARVRRRPLTKVCPVCRKREHWVVVYRLGGRGFPELTAGTFHFKKEADTRRDVVAGELAAMRDPRLLLDEMRTPATPVRTYRDWAAAYKTSRIDLSASRLRGIDTALKALLPVFGDTDPRRQTVSDQIEAVAVLATGRAASTVREYWNHHRQILDFALGDQPNPARDKTVKLPKVVRVEVTPPTATEVLTILDHSPRRRRLPLVTIEQTGMTAGEIHLLEWGDVDEQGCRFRLRQATVKGQIRARARMVQVPEWLMGVISGTCPVEDRTPHRRVFVGQTPDGLGSAMWRACRDAGIPSYSPHDLRHRRASLWHGQGLPLRELMQRVGHSESGTTIDIYSHVLVDATEISREQFEAVLSR